MLTVQFFDNRPTRVNSFTSQPVTRVVEFLLPAIALAVALWAAPASAQAVDSAWCSQAADAASGGEMEHICVDVRANGTATIVRYPARGHVRPNRSLLVVVRHPAGAAIGITYEGVSRGTASGEVTGRRTSESVPVSLEQAVASSPEPDQRDATLSGESVVTTAVVPPLLAGQADIVLHLLAPRSGEGGGQREESAELARLPLTVRNERWGALRIGAGVALSEDLVTGYSTREPEPMMPAQIVRSAGGPYSFDLVLGVSAYLRGRDHQALADAGVDFGAFLLDHVGVYAGLGVLSADASGLSAIQSIYIGIEAEPLPQLSIVFAFVLRRGVQLAQGLEVEDPFSETSVPTELRFAPAFGLLLNFSPDVFQLGG